MKTSAIVVMICFAVLQFSLAAEQGERKRQKNNSTPIPNGTPLSTLSNINQMAAWYSANGEQERIPGSGNSGLTFPRGTATAIYSAGLLWGGQFHDGRSQIIRVNGQSYNNGTTPGAILGIRTGIAENPNSPDVRIWRIRKDYATASLAQDAAEINEVPVGSVTEWMIAAVRSQYRQDWAEWPWQKGAPFYDNGYLGTGGIIIGANNGVLDWGEDTNHNGVLDPGEDLNGNGRLDAESPGLANADQVLWYVCNDIGVAQPWQGLETGMEEQTTIWAYNRSGFIGNVIFKRFRLIYKGIAVTPANATIDSMYIAQWTDPDLGDSGDDFAGCDSTLSLGYVYNGHPTDIEYTRFGLVPPAIGYDLSQGPMIRTNNPADTAIFDFKKISGAKNLPLTSFVYFGPGSTFTDPPFSYSGALQWYQMLRGIPFVDPVTHQPTFFWLNGDPVAGTGWIDGMLVPPGDRRMFMPSGPFHMAVGDTQEVIISVVGGSSPISHLQSVRVMKQTAVSARQMSDALFKIASPPSWAAVSYPTLDQVRIKLAVDGREISARLIQMNIVRGDGIPVASMQLFDDGLHDDGAPNDGIFANAITIARSQQLLLSNAIVTTTQNRTFFFPGVVDHIQTVGSVFIWRHRIFSDNFNNDGRVNPGENIRYGLSVVNGTPFALPGFKIIPTLEVDRKTRRLGVFNAGGVDSLTYNPANPQTYFSVNIPPSYSDSIFLIGVSFADTNNNVWHDTLRWRVYPLPAPTRTAEISHTVATTNGSFQIRVIDPSQARNHLYVIRGVNELGNPQMLGFTLKDSTDGRILLAMNPIPDAYAHNVPLTDGFKVMNGTIETNWGFRSYEYPRPWRIWLAMLSQGINLEGYNGSIGTGFYKWSSGSSSAPSRLRDVVIVTAATDSFGNLLTPNDTTASLAYRYLRNANLPPARPEFIPYIIHPDTGYAYQDFQRSVPFAAYDTSSIPPRRLAVGHLENNVFSGLVDGKYWPPYFPMLNSTVASPMEWFFIFDEGYSATPNPLLQRNIQNDALPIMWWGVPNRISRDGFSAGRRFKILARFPFTSADRWTFNPTVLTGAIVGERPLGFELNQNYPNPFNPTTTIRYKLPVTSRVEMKIYNLLGQEVRTLVSDIQESGEHMLQWNGVNTFGIPVASGVYFYRIQTSGVSERTNSFVQVKKMLLLK